MKEEREREREKKGNLIILYSLPDRLKKAFGPFLAFNSASFNDFILASPPMNRTASRGNVRTDKNATVPTTKLPIIASRSAASIFLIIFISC